MTKTILILTANPKGTSQLRLDQEVRDIDEGLRRSQQRDQFILRQQWAVRHRDIRRAMLDNKPQIVHFSGQGAGEEGLVFEDESGQPKLVTGAALSALFKLFASKLECVVLNGCYSQAQAEAIAEYIPYVIGMNQAIGDKAAIEFAVGFYDALTAGETVKFAYDLGCAAIQMASLNEELTPILIHRSEGKVQAVSAAAATTSPQTVIPPTAPVPTEVIASYSHKDETSLLEDIRLQEVKRDEARENIAQIEEQIKTREKFNNPQLNEARDWLSESKRHRLAVRVGKEILGRPEVGQQFSEEKDKIIEYFYEDIEDYLKLIYYSLVTERFNLLHEPAVNPVLTDFRIYAEVLELIKSKIPSTITGLAKQELEARIDYLSSRLLN